LPPRRSTIGANGIAAECEHGKAQLAHNQPAKAFKALSVGSGPV
jgi:hypothetical protein